MRRGAGWLVVTVAAGLVLAGCGGGSSGAGAGATTTSAATTIPATAIPATTAGPTTSPAGTGGIEGPTDLPTLPPATRPPPLPSPTAGQSQFVTAVFNDIQAEWRSDFARSGQAYSPATLRTFTSAVGTSCGVQSSEVGPFYCPADRTVNLDLRFFTTLAEQFGAGGDFAEAYIVAHEMGHHIQNLLGISTRVAAADQANPAGANALSVRVELQADCFAGVWAHSTYTRSLLEPGDLDQALQAAAVVGDDFLQQRQGSQVEPESWTHGSSAQRQQWLSIGFDSGDPTSCDTFSAQI